MRVKKIHPLCSISLESPGIGDQSPEVSRAVTAASSGGSDGNAGRQVGSDINVAGVLYKWTNYGKGWRFWWFLLRSGVLSYSQIRQSKSLHLPLPADDIRVIGDVPTNRLSRLDSGGGRRKHRKNVGSFWADISGQLTKQKTECDGCYGLYRTFPISNLTLGPDFGFSHTVFSR